MTTPAEILRAAQTVVLHDWPSQEVPDELVAAGLDVTYQGGPDPDDLFVTRLVDGRPDTRKSGTLPQSADVIYSHRPIEEMPRLLEEAQALGARVLWHQSGVDEHGGKDPRGVHLDDQEAGERARLAADAGVQLVTEPYIVDAAREARK